MVVVVLMKMVVVVMNATHNCNLNKKILVAMNTGIFYSIY